MNQTILTPAECRNAAAIQAVVDSVAENGGGIVVLPEMALTIDRGIQLRSNVELVGQGEKTILRKAASKVHPLSGYHNYGMMDVPLLSAEGLEPGMTVSVHDSKTHGGFYETFATITWVDGNWVGIDNPLKADYQQDAQPELTTAFPMIFAHQTRNIAVRDLVLDGNSAENPVRMGSCRGGCIYFANSRGVTVDGVKQHHYNTEGISFQMCADVMIRNSEFSDNTANGMHPGAGSTNVIFENCQAENNQYCGFFFCVRANHIDVKNCEFRNNVIGISIGTRDCYNLIENCRIYDSHDAGLETRNCPKPTEVHNCMIRNCEFRNNGSEKDAPEIRIGQDSRELIFENNRITPSSPERNAVVCDKSASSIYFDNLDSVKADLSQASITAAKPVIEYGYREDLDPNWFRHLYLG